MRTFALTSFNRSLQLEFSQRSYYWFQPEGRCFQPTVFSVTVLVAGSAALLIVLCLAAYLAMFISCGVYYNYDGYIGGFMRHVNWWKPLLVCLLVC
jgi:hypothetical protein